MFSGLGQRALYREPAAAAATILNVNEMVGEKLFVFFPLSTVDSGTPY